MEVRLNRSSWVGVEVDSAIPVEAGVHAPDDHSPVLLSRPTQSSLRRKSPAVDVLPKPFILSGLVRCQGRSSDSGWRMASGSLVPRRNNPVFHHDILGLVPDGGSRLLLSRFEVL